MSIELKHSEFVKIKEIVHQLCGLALGNDKEYLVKTRLEPVLIANGCASFHELINRLSQAGSVLLRDQIIEAITTNETSFNRDTHPFETFRHRILPELVERALDRKRLTGLPFPRIRIWSAAGSTGQEAYSLAMAIDDYVSSQPQPLITFDQFLILCSDISSKALAVARQGEYQPFELARGVSSSLQAKYFQQIGMKFRVIDSIRRNIDFARINVLEPLPNVGTFDLILCRNLLIYFDPEARTRVIAQLAQHLNPQGLLMLGAAESLTGTFLNLRSEFMGQTVLYRKV